MGKWISSALTRPPGTRLVPASLSLPWLAPPLQIKDPTWISTGVAEYVLWHRPARGNDLLPFAHFVKNSVFDVIKCTGDKVKRTCAAWWENNLVCFSPAIIWSNGFSLPRDWLSQRKHRHTQTHTHSFTHPKILAPTLGQTFMNIIIFCISKIEQHKASHILSHSHFLQWLKSSAVSHLGLTHTQNTKKTKKNTPKQTKKNNPRHNRVAEGHSWFQTQRLYSQTGRCFACKDLRYEKLEG